MKDLYKNIEITDKKMEKLGNSEFKSNSLIRRQNNGFEFIKNHISTNDIILDIGARDGMFLQKLKDKNFDNLTGCDISKLAVKKMNKRKGIHGIQGDAHNLPFEDNQFSFIISTHTLEHCHDPDKAISEINRVLKPKGKSFVEVPIENVEKPRTAVGHFCAFRTEDQAIEMFEKAGFKLVSREKDPNPKKHYFRMMLIKKE